MTTRERREARAERLRGWAEAREAKSAGLHERAEAMAGVIPFGQPILVGHHSERRDRNYRAKVWNAMGAAVENDAKAASMARRANSIEAAAAAAIYSDDRDAIERLEERIATLEAERDRIKAYNASCRAAAKAGGTGDLELLDDAQRRQLVSVATHAPYQLGAGNAFPGYGLSNLSGNIKRNRDRLAQLKADAS